MPARPYAPAPSRRAIGPGARLPWWAVALPAMAFAVLLVLMTGSGRTHSASTGPEIHRILDRIQQTLG